MRIGVWHAESIRCEPVENRVPDTRGAAKLVPGTRYRAQASSADWGAKHLPAGVAEASAAVDAVERLDDGPRHLFHALDHELGDTVTA